jgi:hypothetical protein
MEEETAQLEELPMEEETAQLEELPMEEETAQLEELPMEEETAQLEELPMEEETAQLEELQNDNSQLRNIETSLDLNKKTGDGKDGSFNIRTTNIENIKIVSELKSETSPLRKEAEFDDELPLDDLSLAEEIEASFKSIDEDK